MEMTTLGRGGPVVSRVGLGLMGMSGIYGQADDHESIATIHAAIDAGITLLDTGDFYGMGHNELLLRDALRRGIPRDSVFIQVKFGGQRDPSGAFVGHDASPTVVKSSLAYTLTRLGTDYVDLYQPARLDPRKRFPRFRAENHARNLELLAALEAIADDKGATAAQLAIAWVASRGDDIIPLIGTKRRDRLAEALHALTDLTLSTDDLAAIEAAVPADAVAGPRYDAAQVAVLDSER